MGANEKARVVKNASVVRTDASSSMTKTTLLWASPSVMPQHSTPVRQTLFGLLRPPLIVPGKAAYEASAPFLCLRLFEAGSYQVSRQREPPDVINAVSVTKHVDYLDAAIGK